MYQNPNTVSTDTFKKIKIFFSLQNYEKM